MKRVVILSDLHCGHLVGLTHPNYDAEPPKESNEYGLYALRRAYYNAYREAIQKLYPVYAVIVNGDAIDGRGEASGGRELLTTDREKQVNMACAAIKECDARKVFISAGTPYHTGKDEDWESVLAQKLDAQFESRLFLDINGLVFDIKHKVGSSGIPYGRFSQTPKERMWNLLEAEHNDYPKAQIFIRSHVHYFGFTGQADWLGITTPALQGNGSLYGERQVSGTVDFGFIHFDIDDNGGYTWQPHLFKLAQAQIQAVKL